MGLHQLDTALEYKVAAALAAANRVLREHRADLAEECLQTATTIWAYEHAHEPVIQPAAYVPRGGGGARKCWRQLNFY